MVLIAARRLYYQSDQGTKCGKTAKGKQRYRCHNLGCAHPPFLLDPAYKRRLPESKQQVIEMNLKTRRWEARRVLQMISRSVINELKKTTFNQI